VDLSKYKVIIVGAGFFGLTIAERCADELSVPVAVIEKRSHIGGNAYSYTDEDSGIEIHKYGTHLFHTAREDIWMYVNRFSQFYEYRHKVWTIFEQQVYSMPINLQTIAQIAGSYLTPTNAADWIRSHSEVELGSVENFESLAIKSVGKPLYDSLIRGYTLKQWNTDPRELPSEIFSRLPIRYNFNNDYFNDPYQGLPSQGYGKLFDKMVTSKNIDVFLHLDFLDIKQHLSEDQIVIFSGPIDQYFGYCEGRLGWRTLDFETTTIDINDYQGTAVVNYADLEVPYTRIHEYKHLNPQKEYSVNKTIISKEFSREAESGDEPYYPINRRADRELLAKYRELAKKEKVIFGGRLGSYQYLDMHMAIAQAFQVFENQITPLLQRSNG
jgi:UDP-galactopyranose mutase